MEERVKFSFGFPGLPTKNPFVVDIEENTKPSPSNAEILRQIADSVDGSDPMKTIFAGMLRSAAAELDSSFEALKLSMGLLILHGHEKEAKQVREEWLQWKKIDAPQNAGQKEGCGDTSNSL
jgi:hypothetical protein